MSLVGDWLFDNSTRRDKVRDLAISVAGDIKSIEDATNDAIERINGFLGMKRGPVDSSGKTINEFLLDVRRAFEALEESAQKQCDQLSATVDNTVISSVRSKLLGLDLDNTDKRIPKVSPTITRYLALETTAKFSEEVTKCLKETKQEHFITTGGLLAGALAGGLVLFIVEVISGVVESAVLEGYIKELTEAASIVRENRRAIVNTADNLHLDLLRIELIASAGDGKYP